MKITTIIGLLIAGQVHSSPVLNSSAERKAGLMSTFVPERMQRNYTQYLNGKPEAIIPLLAPRAEEKWANGWHPQFIFENSVGSEQGSIFVTEHSGVEEIWIMTKHDLKALRSEFVRFNSDFICEIEIQLQSDDVDRSKSELMYRYTGLTEHGNAYIRRHFTKARFEAMAAEWERELNAFLAAFN